MTDHIDSVDEPGSAQIAALDEELAHTDLWEEPSAGLEDLIVAAITAESGVSIIASTTDDDELAVRRSARTRRAIPWWIGAAAACALVVAGIALVVRDSGSDEVSAPVGTEIALVGTDLAADASATAVVSSTPAGLKIVLDTDRLEPADRNHYYEAWLSDGDSHVSAGTFHLRGASDPIALWSGVDEPSYRNLTVTLEPTDGDTAPSSQVVLTGIIIGSGG